ncbi:MAG: NAD(P)/FAD-dependent oxidoreductase [Solirubrobacteraceae bacterium]|nr:NAD(P)/FAD-dependent oxidoreductase [Solirubrobacteraceae bacterium]
MSTPHHAVAVIGAGFAGLTLGRGFLQAGIEDVVILERGDDVGGVWRENTYPGCACDVPSALYSLSFAPNPEWSRLYATQPEILEYARTVAREHGVDQLVRFRSEVTDARWNAAEQRWRLTTSSGELTANVLITALGPFGDPKVPDLPGLDAFGGTTFHSARWNHDHDLRGERVAVVGTGASAIQFVPEIQPQVQHLTVFQRTPSWVLPRMDHTSPAAQKRFFRRVPAAQRALRGLIYTMIEGLGLVGFVDTRFRFPYEIAGRNHLRRQVKDKALRAKLSPDFMVGCARAVLADRFYPALTQPNVAVETTGIERIESNGIRTADGLLHEVDTIIWGTGFDVPPKRQRVVHGTAGETLADVWATDVRGYLGTTLRDFPNLFTVLGPFSGAGNQSALFMIENQARYIVDAVRTMRREAIGVVEVRPEAEAAFMGEMRERSKGSVWETGGCNSYYTDQYGRNTGLWPNWSWEYRRRTERFDVAAFETTPVREPAHVVA